MKKIYLTVAIIICALLTVVAVACDKQADNGGAHYTVTLNESSVSLNAFERHELTAVVRDAQNNEAEQVISWKSSDEKVAKVENGVIFATGAGTAEVTAAVGDSASAKCVVTVTDNGIIPELRVNTKSLSVGKGQKFTLVPQVFFNGANCTESDTAFTFTSLQEGVATVSRDGVVTAVAAGNAKITVCALWRGLGGPDKNGDESVVAALTLTVDVNVIDLK